MAEKGQPLPKFGEWDVNNPASAEGFTVIFNKARCEKKSGGQIESPGKALRPAAAGSGKPQAMFLDFGMMLKHCFLLLLV
ncbi:RPM1-interacting protein 4-like isoform X1 [Cucurbita maxima]|uniref:RPM1-interacting protein 4-like isoform X1 n=1 Tax=Cucurbita maxima TaxID=3661 RepID=A0A6J1HL52_CUCMA|nr:RPM1-interacting protein 4-like isoform X1 [Cucurbita maxima]